MKEDEYKADTPTAYLTGTYLNRPAGMTDDAIKAID